MDIVIRIQYLRAGLGGEIVNAENGLIAIFIKCGVEYLVVIIIHNVNYLGNDYLRGSVIHIDKKERIVISSVFSVLFLVFLSSEAEASSLNGSSFAKLLTDKELGLVRGEVYRLRMSYNVIPGGRFVKNLNVCTVIGIERFVAADADVVSEIEYL